MNRSAGVKMLSNSFVYICSSLLIKCFGLFLLPIYTSVLTTDDYGITNIANNFILVMSFIAAWSLYSAVMRFYVDLKSTPKKLKRFYGSIILFCGISCAGFAFLLFVGRNILEKHVFVGSSFFPVIFVSLISLFFTCQHTIYENILRSQQKAFKNSVLSIIYFLLTVVLNIVFVVIFKWGAVGVLSATAISGGIYTCYFLLDMIFHKEIIFCLDFKLLKSALKYSIPIIPHNLSTHIATLTSSVLLGGTNTLAALGVYSVARQFGNVADGIQSSVNQAYAPWFYEQLHERGEGYQETVRKTTGMVCSLIGLLFLGIAFFSHDYVVLFVDPAYIESWKYIVLIVLIYAVKTIYYFFVNVLFYYKKAANKIFFASLSGSLVNVFAAFFLIPQIGGYGAILAELLCIIIQVAIVIYMSKKFEDVGLRIKDFIVNIFTIIAFAFLGLIFTYTKYSDSFSFTDFLYRVAIIGCYLTFLFFRYRKDLLKLKKVFFKKHKRED